MGIFGDIIDGFLRGVKEAKEEIAEKERAQKEANEGRSKLLRDLLADCQRRRSSVDEEIVIPAWLRKEN